MIILAVDPGISTGIAVITSDCKLKYSITLEIGYRAGIAELYRRFTPDHIVMEEVLTPGLGELSQKLGLIKNTLKSDYPEAIWVRATDWKPTPFAKYKLPNKWNGAPLTQHQKDAARMAVWFLKTRIGKEE